MARGRKGTAGLTKIEQVVTAYIELSPEDQAYAQAMIRGAQLGARSKQVPTTGKIPTLAPADQRRFEDAGEALAAEGDQDATSKDS